MRLPFYRLTAAYVAAFGAWYLATFADQPFPASGLASALLATRIGLEVLACFYVFSTFLKCFDYLWHRPVRAAESPADERPPVAVIYLCSGDLDRPALQSLLRLNYPGRLDVYVHDDSGRAEDARAVDAAVRELDARARTVHVLRRPVRRGGKPGAVNYVLEALADRYPFVLLCDNDSTALDEDAIQRALRCFDDPRIGAVQFRNVGVGGDEPSYVNRVLSSAIDVFDVFAMHQWRHGLIPFLGHNGMLRTDVLRALGGLREGVFADDVDFSIRMAMAGWRVHYAPDIRFGERHPATYEAFRRRAFKWAFGCGQILREHLIPALRSDRLTAAEKMGFVEFTCFYGLQVVLILYLVLAWIVLPRLAPEAAPGGLPALVGNLVILSSIFLPALVYHARRGKLLASWPFVWMCALVYGSVAFVTMKGVLLGFLGREREWVPTNLKPVGKKLRLPLWLECGFGALLLLAPAASGFDLLYHPAVYLFASVFLMVPLVDFFYGDRAIGPVSHRFAGFALLVCALGASLTLVGASTSKRDSTPRIEGSRFVVAGKPFSVRGIHYGPWRPGTGPGKEHAWPSEDEIRGDLAMIEDLGANTILVHDAPASILRAARAHGLMVMVAFYVNWQSIDDDEVFAARRDEIVRSVADMEGHPNLLGVLLGNEVVAWVRDQYGTERIASRLRDLFEHVKQVAPRVPVSHANWPITLDLDLSFMDFAAFNLYPAWPREVSIMGYGRFIRQVLLPEAAGRPVLVTEFGQNSLEVPEERQAELLIDCWGSIRELTAGGFVFEFADEWWKNYDNPVEKGVWWKREHAPDDEVAHDLDPEEYYGIFDSARRPKLAVSAVRQMFHEESSGRSPWWYGTPLLGLVLYTAYLFGRGDPDRRAKA